MVGRSRREHELSKFLVWYVSSIVLTLFCMIHYYMTLYNLYSPHVQSCTITFPTAKHIISVSHQIKLSKSDVN